ncbi:MAG: hypothetical protein WA956_13335 [Stenotrophomonas sp.]
MKKITVAQPGVEGVSGWLENVVAPVAELAQKGARPRVKASGTDPRSLFRSEFKKQQCEAQVMPHGSSYDKAC